MVAVSSCEGSMAFPFISAVPFRATVFDVSAILPKRPLETSQVSFWLACDFLVSHGECLLRRHVPVRAVCVCLVRKTVSRLATSQTPLIGFVKDSPPSTSLWESTPERAVARSSVRCVPSRALVPSLSFHPTPTVYSSHSFVGLLHPTADPGVRRVLISAGGR